MAGQQVPFVGKILPPREKAEVVHRRRLLDILHKNFDRRLVTISAPAGYGKTTLAASFAKDTDLPVCWYSLDESDADLPQFLEYLVASLQRCFPGLGDQALEMLRSSSSPPSANRLVGTLATEIYSGVSEYFLLVLDDFHLVQDNQDVRAAVDLLMTSVPDTCHVLLLSRTPPPLPSLPRLIANREALRLTAKDLAFDDEEVGAFLPLVGADRSAEEVHELVGACEGWIAGIVLSVLGGKAPSGPAAGGDQEWFDYVMAEVYERLPEATRTFLKRSSILYELRPSHCNAIFRMKNAEVLLRDLCDSLQLVTRLEGEEEEDLYRYHHLFRGFLLKMLEQDRAELLRLHRRAGAHYGEQRLWEAAISHLCAAAAFGEAAEAIGQAAGEVYEAGQWTRLAAWIDRLPRPVLDLHPSLLIARARAAAQLGEGDVAIQLANDALDMLREGPDALLAQAHVAKAAVLRAQGLLDRCREECDRAVRLMGEPHDRMSRLTLAEALHYRATAHLEQARYREAIDDLGAALELYRGNADLYHVSYVHHHLGAAYRKLGDFGSAAAHYAEAQAGWERLGNHTVLASTLNNLGNLYLSRGHLELARETLSQAAENARESGATRILSYIYTSLGEILGHEGQFQESLQAFEEGLRAARAASEHKTLIQGTEGMALMHLALGDTERARLLIDQAGGLAGDRAGDDVMGHLLTSAALIRSACNERDAARELLTSARDLLTSGSANEVAARCYFHLAAFGCFDAGQPPRELISQVEALLPESGMEASVLLDARLNPAFVRQAAVAGAPGGAFRRLAALVPEDGKRRHDAVAPGGSRVAPQIRAYSLGRTRVEVAAGKSREAQWPREKAKEFFFYLLWRDGWARKEEIIEALWPDMDEAKGNTIFWTTSYRVRQAMEHCVLRNGTFYRINPDSSLWWDAREFGDLLREAYQADADERRRAANMEQAVELYQGPFLGEVYSEWAEETRSRLQNQYLSALVGLARLRLASMQVDEAAELAGRALQVDAYDDEPYAIMMEAYSAAGRLPEACGVFQRYERLVREELSAEPNPKLAEMYRDIRERKLAQSART